MTNKLTPKQWADDLLAQRRQWDLKGGQIDAAHLIDLLPQINQAIRDGILAAAEHWGKEGFEAGRMIPNNCDHAWIEYEEDSYGGRHPVIKGYKWLFNVALEWWQSVIKEEKSDD